MSAFVSCHTLRLILKIPHTAMVRIVVLGSGTSHGVPVPGCICPVCRSNDKRDKRTRASLYIEGRNGEKVLVDAGPEFRFQCLRAGITGLDAVFLTHAHADHIHGIDDVRSFSIEKPLPVYGNQQTIDEFRERFSYIFRETQIGGGKPRIELRAVKNGERVRLGNLIVTAVPVRHGELDILGWAFTEAPIMRDAGQSVVYLTDTSGIPDESYHLIMEQTGKPAVLVIDALREKPHETHFNFDQALRASARIEARQTYFTHICHAHSHREIESYCRKFTKKNGYGGSIMPAWDELELRL